MKKIISIMLAVIMMSMLSNVLAETNKIISQKPENILWMEYLKMSDCPYHLADTVAPNGLVYKAMIDDAGNPYWHCSEKSVTFVFTAIEYDDGTMGEVLGLINENQYFYFILEEERVVVYNANPFTEIGSFKKAQLDYWYNIEIDGDEIKLVFEKTK